MAANNMLTIKIVPGDIVTFKTDVCVTSVHRSKDMTKGPLASHILHHGGKEVKHELSKVNGTEELEHGQVAIISPGNLGDKFKQLMAVCLYSWKPGNDEILMRAVSECLELTDKNRFKSIAIPALGMGGLKYPPFNVAMAILIAIVNFGTDNPDSTLETVYLPLRDDDENSIRTFLQTTIAFVQGLNSGRDDPVVILEGVNDFKGLQSTKPRESKPPQSVALKRPLGAQIMENILSFSESLISPPTYSGQVNNFKYSISPNISLRDRSAGVKVELGVDLEKYIPGFINKLIPRA